MPKTKHVNGIPKWIQDPPPKERKKMIKDNSYSFIETLALKGKMPKSATLSIQDFLQVDAFKNTAFENINGKSIKTKYALIEYIHNCFKYSMTKVEKEIKDGSIVIGPTNEIEYDEHQSPHDSQAGQEKHEPV